MLRKYDQIDIIGVLIISLFLVTSLAGAASIAESMNKPDSVVITDVDTGCKYVLVEPNKIVKLTDENNLHVCALEDIEPR